MSLDPFRLIVGSIERLVDMFRGQLKRLMSNLLEEVQSLMVEAQEHADDKNLVTDKLTHVTATIIAGSHRLTEWGHAAQLYLSKTTSVLEKLGPVPVEVETVLNQIRTMLSWEEAVATALHDHAETVHSPLLFSD